MEEEFKRLDSEKGWEEYFELLLKKSRKHSTDIGESVTNESLNRYLNVLPYDRSRVRLNRTLDNDYINASLVTVPKAARQYIITQGPLPETVGHFWLMVWEQKSFVIVMLNKCDGAENFVDCEQYWPDAVDSTKQMPDVKLTVTLTKVEEKARYSLRTMLLEDHETNKSRTITQFQYKFIADQGQRELSAMPLLRLLTAMRKSGGLDKMDEPTIVHCSDGQGRSGMFCLIDSVLSMVENQGSIEGIDIANTLLEMRDYRMGLIQSPVQLRFAYLALICGSRILESAQYLSPTNIPGKHSLLKAMDYLDELNADKSIEALICVAAWNVPPRTTDWDYVVSHLQAIVDFVCLKIFGKQSSYKLIEPDTRKSK